MDESATRNGGGVDLISALPDELLLQILERLGCGRATARTGILSCRWRHLWTLLPKVTVSLHDVPFASLETALHRAARPGLCHYLILDIRVPGQDDRVEAHKVSSLLHAAAGLSPAELRLTLPRNLKVSCVDVMLPNFRRATSIELHARDLHLVKGKADCGPFHSLEKFSISGCHIDLATFIPRCPRLRLLRLSAIDLVGMCNITVHSASLEELVVEHKNRWTCLSRISIEAPLLKQLTISFQASSDVGVSILAPMVELVSWRCLYTRLIYGLGLWGLLEVGLKTAERTDSLEDACLQLPSIHVLSLHMCAQVTFSFPYTNLSFATEIDKHTVTNFSSLDLHLTAKGHVFGPFVLHLLGMHRICTAIRNLKIVLLRSEVEDVCPADCLCDEPKDWRTQSVSLAGLEKVEIEGVKGEDHEFEFLKVIFRCAPVLKNLTVKLSDGVTTSVDWCTKINNIFMALTVVQCTFDLGPGWFDCVNDIAIIHSRLCPLCLPKKWTPSWSMLWRCFCRLYASLFRRISFSLMYAARGLNLYFIYMSSIPSTSGPDSAAKVVRLHASHPHTRGFRVLINAIIRPTPICFQDFALWLQSINLCITLV